MLMILLIFVYFIPSMIAFNKSNIGQVFSVNLLLGWSFIGWVVALVMSLKNENDNNQTNNTKDQPWSVTEPSTGSANELEALDRLRKKGVITEKEFQDKKRNILQ